MSLFKVYDRVITWVALIYCVTVSVMAFVALLELLGVASGDWLRRCLGVAV